MKVGEREGDRAQYTVIDSKPLASHWLISIIFIKYLIMHNHDFPKKCPKSRLRCDE